MAKVDFDIKLECCTTSIEKAKQKMLELRQVILELKKLGFKNKTINLIVRDVCVGVREVENE